MPESKKTWDWEITSKTSYWGWSGTELWAYRHLLGSLVRRDFLLNYQQTVLGPIWILLQPLMTLATYVVVFGKLVGVSTGSLPPVLFYFSGIVLWNFFSDSFSGTSNTFRDNAQVFSKVYFPRIIVPMAVTSTQFLRFLIQFAMLLLLIGYYWAFRDLPVPFSVTTLAFPFAIVCIGGIGLGLGLFFSVITAKYRDIGGFVSLGIRLLMYVTPVIYPLKSLPENLRWIVELNPLTPLFELGRLSLLGEGTVTPVQLLYSLTFMIVILSGAMLVFNKQGDKLIDVV
ncbi:ABC transporter permease [Pontibacter liquoris]|uniref:ABC transporter permease n=1 Tax=Pontibacter liquoris TaxID=2905677 RepID=UPI001FA7F4DB|nr:ABC transporter permease [Pontibacter liquoris]